GYVPPARSTMRNAARGFSTFNSFAGVAPSATFVTTTVKLRIRPLVGSHAMTAELSDSACTSVRTTLSLASSGGIAIASPLPPRDGSGSVTVVGDVAVPDTAGAGRGFHRN